MGGKSGTKTRGRFRAKPKGKEYRAGRFVACLVRIFGRRYLERGVCDYSAFALALGSNPPLILLEKQEKKNREADTSRLSNGICGLHERYLK